MKHLPYLVLCLVLLAACAEATPPPTATSTLTPTLSLAQMDATSGARVQTTRRAQATQDAQTTATAQAQATLDAATTATEEALSATQMASLQATAQAMQTTQADWPMVVEENFSAENALGWPLGPEHDSFLAVTTLITNSQYVWLVNVAGGNSYFNFIPTHSPILEDFYAAVDVQFLVDTDAGQYAYGLTFRHVADDYGFCGVRSDGQLRLLAVFDTGIYQLISIAHPAIQTGAKAINRVAVRAVGDNFVCFINEQPVWAFNEAFAPGVVGLGVDTIRASGASQVAFSNFVVYAPNFQR